MADRAGGCVEGVGAEVGAGIEGEDQGKGFGEQEGVRAGEEIEGGGFEGGEEGFAA